MQACILLRKPYRFLPSLHISIRICHIWRRGQGSPIADKKQSGLSNFFRCLQFGQLMFQILMLASWNEIINEDSSMTNSKKPLVIEISNQELEPQYFDITCPVETRLELSSQATFVIWLWSWAFLSCFRQSFPIASERVSSNIETKGLLYLLII